MIITSKTMEDKTSWPVWLQTAWERDWGAHSAFEPMGEGRYLARNAAGNERTFGHGDSIYVRHVA